MLQYSSREFGLEENPGLACDRDGHPLVGARLLQRVRYVPIAFLGLAFYRAWIELVFVGSFIDFPFARYAGHDCFDAVMIAVLFLCASLARKIGPFYRRRSLFYAMLALLLVATLSAFLSLWQPQMARMLSVSATVAGGSGVALAILFWSEIYSCLSAYRVGLYYCASIVVAALTIYVCRGFSLPWLFGAVLALPFISAMLVGISYLELPTDELPHESTARFSFPWKPTLLMAIYAFAFGLREISQYQSSFGPHSAFGTLFVGLFIFLLICKRGDHFDFTNIYRIALPLMVGAFMVLPAFGWLGSSLSDFCAMAGYTAFSILIMLILAHLSHSYGISAIWLFGIERGIRALFSMLGRWTSTLLGQQIAGVDAQLVIGSITVLLVVLGTMVLMSERGLSSSWGMISRGDGADALGLIAVKQQDLENRCRDLARDYELSSREEEVLQLLAHRMKNSQIEQELFISKDTAKTHIRHIYRKLDVHSRGELYDKIGLEDNEA